MIKSQYLIYKRQQFFKSMGPFKSRYGHNNEQYATISQEDGLHKDILVGTADTEEECEKFINNLAQIGTFYWVKGIVKTITPVIRPSL